MDAPPDAMPCPRCGAPAPDGICPACLLQVGTESLTRATLDDAPTWSAYDPPDSTPARTLEPDAIFGPYRIVRLLGRGGMGEVHEAEHLDTGRRVALKILRGRLRQPEDRARFIREGQLAASISHPHTVYIFGSEEIQGQPVITMELVPGGTLKDRVAAAGPLPIEDAVSSVLDIIGGLDAAQAAGVLHRDVKPSNCFVDDDGAVKIGDFGLSISTLARDVRQSLQDQGFQGTPQFAPPEQLRGEPLDHRADIYAIGATLFYVLTGRAPYEAADLPTLVSRVLEGPVPSIRAIRPDVPADLARVIDACLARTPASRPATYVDLAERLRPFSARTARPAPLPQRLLAGVIDTMLLSLPMAAWNAWSGASMTVEPAARATATLDDVTWLFSLTYYAILEGIWGASLGKRLFGLRVTADGRPPSAGAMARRLLVYHVPSLVLLTSIWVAGRQDVMVTLQRDPRLAGLVSAAVILMMAGLFITARRANGWAALHDLASGTRVVGRVDQPQRIVNAASAFATLGTPVSGLRCGPFEAVIDAGATDGGRLLVGVDAVLRRRVWLHVVSRGTPPVPPARRDVSRIGRLHWLAGRRSPEENWDAYEAPDGQPWIGHAGGGQWRTTRVWLADLARELTASSADGTMPPLSTDRLSVRADGHLVLLDLPLPQRGITPSPGVSPLALLQAVAAPATDGAEAAKLPLSARTLVARWRQSPEPSLEQIARDLDDIATAPVEVARWRRAIPIALASVPLGVLLAGGLLAANGIRAFVTAERMEMISLLDALASPAAEGARLAQQEIRTDVERYLATVHRETMTSPSFWRHPAMGGNLSRLQGLAIDITTRHASEPAAVDTLRRQIAPEITGAAERFRRTVAPGLRSIGVTLSAILATISMAVVVVLSLLSALIVPGGIVTRLAGLAVVNQQGELITRGRSVLRTMVAWAPMLIWCVWLTPRPIARMADTPWGILVTLTIVGVGAIVTVIRPTRGLHDRLTGCRVIPR